MMENVKIANGTIKGTGETGNWFYPMTILKIKTLRKGWKTPRNSFRGFFCFPFFKDLKVKERLRNIHGIQIYAPLYTISVIYYKDKRMLRFPFSGSIKTSSLPFHIFSNFSAFFKIFNFYSTFF